MNKLTYRVFLNAGATSVVAVGITMWRGASRRRRLGRSRQRDERRQRFHGRPRVLQMRRTLAKGHRGLLADTNDFVGGFM